MQIHKPRFSLKTPCLSGIQWSFTICISRIQGYFKTGEQHKSLEIDPYAADVVRAIFRKRLDGYSALNIANELNRMGILSPLAYKRNNGLPHAKGGYTDRKDCGWSATTVIRILQDETYTGMLVQGKQSTPHFKLKALENKPSSEWVRYENAHEAIISKHDFDLVQRIRGIDTRTSPKEKTVYLFSGMLICGCCGGRMTRKINRYKGKEYVYYFCPTGKKHGCSNGVMVKESDLTECVQTAVKGHIDNIASLDLLLSSISHERINRELAREYAGHIKSCEKQLEKTESYKSKLYENLVNGMLTKEEFLSYKRKYNADIESMQAAINGWNEKLTDVLENRSERNRWINHFMKFSQMEEIDRKVFCGYCDHAMSRKGKNAVFYCRHSEVSGNLPCYGLQIKAADLEKVIFDTLRAQLLPVLGIDADKDNVTVQTMQQVEYESKLQSLRDKKRMLYEQYVFDEIDLDAYKAQKDSLDAEVVNAKNAYTAISARTKQAEADYELRQKQQATARELSDAKSLTQSLSDRLISRVYIFKDNRIEIDYICNDFLAPN